LQSSRRARPLLMYSSAPLPQAVGKSNTGNESWQRMPAPWAREATTSGKKYMSLKVVVPARSISAIASCVPSRTKPRLTWAASAGQICSCSHGISGRSSA
jgi:hypothetical protein